LVYDGQGLYAFKKDYFCFWEDGPGTVFENGVRNVSGIFELGKLRELQTLYDMSGKILWTLTDGPFVGDGKLNGTGVVFSEAGDPLYELTFESGALVSEAAFWKKLPRSLEKADGIDPITKEPFRKGRLGIRLNKVLYSFQTLKDYWRETGFGKDPLSDRYSFRFELVKFT
jgi:hypothetical protein